MMTLSEIDRQMGHDNVRVSLSNSEISTVEKKDEANASVSTFRVLFCFFYLNHSLHLRTQEGEWLKSWRTQGLWTCWEGSGSSSLLEMRFKYAAPSFDFTLSRSVQAVDI